MRAKVSELVRRALMLIDESEEELAAAVTYGDMGMELRRLASELAVEAARKTLLEMDLDTVSEAQVMDGAYRKADGVGELDVPKDFLRLVELRMDDWREGEKAFRRPAGEDREGWSGPVLLHHPEVRRQYEGITAEPAVEMSWRGAERVLRIYGSRSEGRPVTALYLPEPKEDTSTIWIPSGTSDQVSRTLAQLVKDVITS